MNKYFILCLVFTLSLSLTSIGVAKDYNYISPQDLKVRLDAGEIEKGKMIMISSQTDEEYASGHLAEAIPTFARPLKSEADYQKLDAVMAQIQTTDTDIILICPRGKSGATLPFDYFEEKGIDSNRMLILTGGQEAYNKAFPQNVIKLTN